MKSEAATITIVVEPQSTVSSNNRAAHFNWQFESESGNEPIIGQYACGSYWVAPAEGDSGVRLISLLGSGKAGQTDLLSLDADPNPTSHGLVGFGKTYGNYNPDENDEPKLPLVYSPPTNSAISLVAAMQRNEAETSNAGTSRIYGGAVDAYCFVTLLPSPPPNNGVNSIRPNIVGDQKDFFTWDDFDLSRLPSYSFIGSHSESFQSDQTIWNHSTEVFSMRIKTANGYEFFSEGGRAFRAHILHHNYASSRASVLNSTLMKLLGTDSMAIKKPLLASILAHGLDTWHLRYGISEHPGAWDSGAGQKVGQFNTPAFLSALLKAPDKAIRMRRTVVENYTESNKYRRGPQEMRQIMRGQTGVPLWGDEHDHLGESSSELVRELHIRYWSNFLLAGCYEGSVIECNPGFGSKTVSDPHGFIDGPAERPGSNYYGVTTGPIRSVAALMLLFPEFGEVVNCNEIIEYADRVGRWGVWTWPDPVAAPTSEDQTNGCSPWRSSSEEKCQGYRTLWGPTLDDRRYAVENDIGRTPYLHGQPSSLRNTTGLVEENWDEIISRYNGPTFEDTEVPLGTVVAPDIYFFNDDTGAAFAFLRCSTFDSIIHYEIGDDVASTPSPSTASPIYSTPIPVSVGQFIKVYAVKDGLENSTISTKQLLWNPEIIPDETAPSLSGIIVSNVTSNSAVIEWSTDEGATSVVNYGLTTNYGQTAISDDLTTSHSFVITGLRSDTTYHYRVQSADSSNNETTSGNFTFTTLIPDTIAPTSSLTSPTNGTVLLGQVDLVASAFDNTGGSGIESVKFLLDGNIIGIGSLVDSTTTFTFQWNTITVGNGSYTLQAVATDGDGNESLSDSIDVTIDNPALDLMDGTVSFWTFNEGIGTTVSDVSGNNNTATLNGATWIAEGQSLGALSFDGVDDYVDCGGLDISGNAMTIALWMNADDLTETQDARLVSKANGSSENAHYWMLSTFSVGSRSTVRFRLKTNGNTTTLIAPNGELFEGQWYHVAAVYDGSQMRLYQDGVEIGQIAKNGAISTSSAVQAWVGQNPNGYAPFHGSLDEVRLYDRALSPAEIQTLALGSSTDETPPVLSEVTVSNITSNSALITWSTDKNATSSVDYGTTTQYGLVTTTGSLQTSHEVTLTGLQSDTLYHFRVHTADAVGNEVISGDFTFNTLTSVDTTPPNIVVTQPSEGDVVNGLVVVTVDASDNDAISQVVFEINGIELEIDTVDPYTFSWSTFDETNGSHSITATATDSSGNTTSYVVNVTVENVPGTTGGLPPSLFMNEDDLIRVQGIVADSSSPFYENYQLLLSRANSALGEVPDPFSMADISQIQFGWCQSANSPDDSLRDLTKKLETQSDRGRTLALAWLFTGNQSYADSAVEMLSAWASESTLLNLYDLNINFDDATFDGSTNDGYCGVRPWNMALDATWQAYGLINFADSYIILKSNGYPFSAAEENLIRNFILELTEAVNSGFHAWTRWADAHPTSSSFERYRSDNHLSWCLAGLISGAVALEDEALADYVLNGGAWLDSKAGNYVNPSSIRSVIDYVIEYGTGQENEGRIYEEKILRNPPISYSFFHLWPMALVATVAEKHYGDDIWNFKGADGGGMREAYDRYSAHVLGERESPNPGQDGDMSVHYWHYEFAHTKWGTKRFEDILLFGSRNNYIKQSAGPINLLLGREFGFISIDDIIAPVLSEVTVSSVTSNSATVTWNTDESATSMIDYGTTTAYDQTTTISGSTTTHSLTITDLQSGTTYYYRVRSADASGNETISENFTFTTSVIGNEELNTGLVGYWNFDETSGNIANDVSPSNRNGNVEGADWTTEGYTFGALNFDGSNDYVDVGNLDIVGSSMTISFWMKSDNLLNGSGDSRLISKANGSNEQNHYWMLSTYSQGSGSTIRFRLKTGGTTSTLIAPNGNLINNQWYHIVAVYDGTQMRLYQDGVEIGQLAKTGTLSTNSSISAWIGQNPNNYAAFDGAIDEVRLYNRALSPAEIIDLRDVAPPTVPQGLRIISAP